MRSVAIVQSNYIPWKGYFDLIAKSDVFVLFDEVQYTKRDWRNRNLIKTKTGLQWISVPVLTKGRYHQKISETAIDGQSWKIDHFKAFQSNYAKAPFFSDIISWLKPYYFDNNFLSISQLNLTLIHAICDYLNITTEIVLSTDVGLSLPNQHKNSRLIQLCKHLNASVYISGPKARSYLDQDLFHSNQINVSWFSYDDYPPHPQLWGDFHHNVSILDLLFNCGLKSTCFMKFVK